MTEPNTGRLDRAIDEVSRRLYDQEAAGLRQRVLTRLEDRHIQAKGVLAFRKVAAGTLVIAAVALVGRLTVSPPADAPPASSQSSEVATGSAPELPGVLSSRTEQAGSVAIAMPPGGNERDAISSASSAAPTTISDDATIMTWDGTVVRQGLNAWTCLPDRLDTGRTDPWCLIDTSLISSWSEAVRVGGNIRPPARVVDVPPVFPPAARAAGQGGLVVLEAVIGLNGQVVGARTLVSSGYDLLDQAAFETALSWSYDVTVLNGRPVPVVMTLTVNFLR